MCIRDRFCKGAAANPCAYRLGRCFSGRNGTVESRDDGGNRSFTQMITMKELEAPVRQWVPDWLGLISIFIVILPVTMLNGSYTGSMLEVSNTLGTNSEDITMGYYAASAGMAIAYPIIPKVLAAFSVKSLLLIDLVLQFFLSWVCARTQNADILIVCSFAVGFLKGFLMLWFILSLIHI